MPWRGWLIAFSVIALSFTMITVAMIMTGSMRNTMSDDDNQVQVRRR